MLQEPSGHILLEQRSQQGIWGGLWSFPELPMEADAMQHSQARFGDAAAAQEIWPVFRHTFSHYHLHIQPVLIQLSKKPTTIGETNQHWYNPAEPSELGLAAPVKTLLTKL